MKSKIILLLFFYVYPLFFMGIPLSTRVVFGVLGGLSFFVANNHSFGEFRLLKPLLPIMAWSAIVGTINQTFDYFFVFYGISIILIFFACIFIRNKIKFTYSKNSFIEKILLCFIAVVIIQSLFATFFYFIPSLQTLCHKIFPLTDQELNSLELAMGTRFIGLGSCFFGAGVIHGLALICMAYIFLNNTNKSIIIWVISYMMIFFVGFMMARTTVIGLLLSLFMIYTWKVSNHNIVRRKIILLFLFCAVILLFLSLIFTYLDEKVLMQAFEFFYNYNDNGNFESESTNQLMDMYKTPTSLWTYIIGDGKYNLTSGGYYMNTDVGYLRLLYYGGLPLIIFFFYFQLSMVKRIIKLGVSPLFKRLLYISIFYLLILNTKGFVDLSPYYLLLYIILYDNSRIKKASR